jgi:hypothetical protein
VSDMASQAADLARCLARDAEAVCRHYLSNGRRRGCYWVVGDVVNTPGRSLFVRLTGPDRGKGAAGKWTDAATGQHGDLLDLIALNQGLERLRDVLDEARSFLSLPRPEPPSDRYRRQPPAPRGSPEAARRLFAMAQPISGTIVEAYLRNRGITALHDAAALRFHPRCYYRPDADAPTEVWPALVAAVTDLAGSITGAHRTWLDPTGEDKAPDARKSRSTSAFLQNRLLSQAKSWRAINCFQILHGRLFIQWLAYGGQRTLNYVGPGTWRTCLIVEGTTITQTIATDYAAVAGGVGGVKTNSVRR